jgi:acetamidase/formamidase
MRAAFSAVVLASVAAPLAAALAQSPRVHRLPATPQTVVYGYYWSEARPVLRIQSGDIIDVSALLTSNPASLERAGVPAAEVQESLRSVFTARNAPDSTGRPPITGPGGHVLTGPVYVEGAEPGDVLEVKILSVNLEIPYGYNGCSGFVRALCEPGPGRTRIIRIDTSRMVGLFAPGIEVPLRPFFGSMGVSPPAEFGRVSSNPPHIHAGNLDNRELVAGTTLYIPVHVRGALFEVGDGHAAQGDGEVDQTAIETSLRGQLQLTVRKDMKLDWPRGETPQHWISMGMDSTLTIATRIAIEEMVELIMEKSRLGRMESYQLASIAADLRITQLVDGTMGVHMMIRKSLLARRDE